MTETDDIATIAYLAGAKDARDKLTALQAHADALARELGRAKHFMEKAQADPDSLKERFSVMVCFSDNITRAHTFLRAYEAFKAANHDQQKEPNQ